MSGLRIGKQSREREPTGLADLPSEPLGHEALGEGGGEVAEGGPHNAAAVRGGVDVLAVADVDAHVVHATAAAPEEQIAGEHLVERDRLPQGALLRGSAGSAMPRACSKTHRVNPEQSKPAGVVPP